MSKTRVNLNFFDPNLTQPQSFNLKGPEFQAGMKCYMGPVPNNFCHGNVMKNYKNQQRTTTNTVKRLNLL